MSRVVTRWLTMAACLCLVTLLQAAPQQTDSPGTATSAGRLEGRVTKDGQAVGGVVVIVTGLNLTETTDQDGRFVFATIPAGVYTLQLILGDNRTAVEEVGILAGQTRELEVPVDWDIGLTETVTVTAAAARAAKIVDAPAAVTAIPEEEIEREAAAGQVPKILEFTPGAEVTQSGLYDFNFNTRGFNSSLNRRVSTYIDGRDVGVVLLGAQEWSAIAGGLDDLAGLEFIRGPSAALYGANASSGVINITTKAPRDSMGGMVRLTAGELDTQSIDFRYAGQLSNDWYWKVLAGGKKSGDFSISRNPDGPDQIPGTPDDLAAPEYSQFCQLIGERDCLPKERTLFREQDDDIAFGSVRFDRYLGNDALLSFEGGISDIAGPVFQTGIGRVQNRGSQRPFFRFNWFQPRWNVLAHFSERTGDQANLTADLVADYALVSDTQRYGVEAQGNWDLFAGRGRFVIGGAFTHENVDTACDQQVDPLLPQPCDKGEQTVVFEPIENERQAIFSQFDWQASERWKLVFAGRMDWNDLHETQFSPKAAVVYSVTPKHSFRGTYNEAFQVANYSEFFLHARISTFPMGGFVKATCVDPFVRIGMDPIDCGIPVTDENGQPTFIPILAVGNNDLKLEKTQQWEIGYSGLIGKRAFLTLDYYNSKNTDFITDLVPQIGTSLGICLPDNPEQDPTQCPINNDYKPWVSTEEAETTPFFPPLTVAQALRNTVESSVGGSSLGFALAQDLDGSTVVVGRTYSNVGNVDTQGIDFGFQIFVSEAWNLQGSYSWFDFEILDKNADVADILLPNTPEHKTSLSLTYRKKKIAASISGRWVDGFRWSAGVFQGDVPSYATGDISASYVINDLVAVGVNVANFTDNIHRQTFGGDLLSRRALAYVTFRWQP